MKPAPPRAAIGVSALILFVWWVVAHNSGSGWVQTLGDAVFGILSVGVLGPALALRRIRVRLLQAPSDGTAGFPIQLRLETSVRVRAIPMVPPGEPVIVGRQKEMIVLLPTRRGVHDHFVVEVSTAAPFGLQWWSRKVVLPLPNPLHVAPRLGARLLIEFGEGDGSEGTPVRSHVGEPHAARPYEPGDQRRRVHWPSTAHTGKLMVRELEEPSAEPLVLVVSLPNDPEAAEHVTERALGTAVSLLDAGAALTMVTDEVDGPVTKPVTTRLEAGRRLARAAPSDGKSRLEVIR